MERILEKPTNKMLLAIALGLSLLTVFLIYTFLQSAAKKSTLGAGETVIIAKMNIPAKTRVSSEMVQESRVPPEYIQPGAIREMPQVVGAVTREESIAGEQLTDRRLMINGKYAGFSGVIPAGKRALTVAATDVTGVAGLLKAGDYVDVLVTFDQKAAGDIVTQMVMQNILVLSVNRENLAEQDGVAGKNSGKKDASKDPALAKVANVTLAVSPEEAARVTIAEEKGKVRLALRPYLPENATYVAQPVYPSDLVGAHQTRGGTGAYSGGSGGSGGSQQSSGNAYGIPVIRGTKIQ